VAGAVVEGRGDTGGRTDAQDVGVHGLVQRAPVGGGRQVGRDHQQVEGVRLTGEEAPGDGGQVHGVQAGAGGGRERGVRRQQRDLAAALRRPGPAAGPGGQAEGEDWRHASAKWHHAPRP
jgi:hypothetical protein